MRKLLIAAMLPLVSAPAMAGDLPTCRELVGAAVTHYAASITSADVGQADDSHRFATMTLADMSLAKVACRDDAEIRRAFEDVGRERSQKR